MEKKKCENCKKGFVIEPDDFGFYDVSSTSFSCSATSLSTTNWWIGDYFTTGWISYLLLSFVDFGANAQFGLLPAIVDNCRIFVDNCRQLSTIIGNCRFFKSMYTESKSTPNPKPNNVQMLVFQINVHRHSIY